MSFLDHRARDKIYFKRISHISPHLFRPTRRDAILELFPWKKRDARGYEDSSDEVILDIHRIQQLYTSETAVSLADLSVPDKLSVACAAAKARPSRRRQIRALSQNRS